MPIRRTLKNVVKNYSDAQIKVREATSNDAWGPSTTLMSEIADLTYNVVAYAEIMPIIWRRLEDSGRNWRHVYKSLVLLDYLVRTGSERVARECRERAWAIQGIADSFEFAESTEGQQDHAAGVRERARALTALLRDDDRLRNERAKALKARERFAQNSSAVSASSLGTGVSKSGTRSISPLHSISAFADSSIGGGGGGYAEFGSPSMSSLEAAQFAIEGGTGSALETELESLRPTSAGEEELQLQLALAMSKEEHDEEVRRKKGDEAKLQMALDESRRQSAAAAIESPVHSAQYGIDPLLDVHDVDGKKADPWNSSPSSLLTQHLTGMTPKSSWTESSWMNSPAMLPPPPLAKISAVHAPAAPVNVDPWQSSVESSQSVWAAATTVSLSPTVSQAGSSSVATSWQSPAAHQFPSNSNSLVDNEFDMLGTRSRSPMMTSTACTVPSSVDMTADAAMRHDAWNFSGMEQLVSVDDKSSAASGTTDTVESVPAVQSSATQCQKKSAQSFLGDNANLVNLDNLISFSSSSPSRMGNPFTSPNRHHSPSVTPTPNPFNQPASSQPISASPATVNAASNHNQASYPSSFNPFM